MANSKPLSFLVTFADDREIDVAEITAQRDAWVRSGRLKFLRTGVGKVRAATEVTSYLTNQLKARQPRPHVVSVGTCIALDPTLTEHIDKIVRPCRAVDRDAAPPELLEAAHIKRPSVIPLDDADHLNLTIGTGDGFVSGPTEVARLLAAGVHLVDMETHAVGWASLRCLAGPALSVRYVSDLVNSEAPQDWSLVLARARVVLTEYILQITA